MNGDEDMGGDMGLEAGPEARDPTNYHEAAKHLYTEESFKNLPRGVNESPKRDEPVPSDEPTPARKAAMERGAARHGNKGKTVAPSKGDKKKRHNTDRRGTAK
jgi:hypothetical protein